MAKVLVRDESRCTGCLSCQVWCSSKQTGEVNPALARLVIVGYPEKASFVPVVCHHCRDPWCMKVCPAEAMARDPKTNAVLILQDRCVGCGACAEACPFGVIRLDSKGGVFKCDLCQGDPECVKSCNRKALAYVEPEKAYLDRAAAAANRIGGAV